nr:hypothetical protein [Tanacetum cinerariifolium]
MSSEEDEKESTNIDPDDDETHVAGSMVESFRIKKVKKFDFVTKDGKHIHLTKEQINKQKKIKEEEKAKAVKRESKVRKEELVDLLGPEVVNKYYNDKLHGSESEEGLCKELQFGLVDNSKLNVVYLLNRSMKRSVSLLEGLQGRKRLLYVKTNKAISLRITTSKVGIEVQQLFLK